MIILIANSYRQIRACRAEGNRAYIVSKQALATPKIVGQRPLAATQPAGLPDTTQWPKVVSISGCQKAA